jgi:hypothetical protein
LYALSLSLVGCLETSRVQTIYSLLQQLLPSCNKIFVKILLFAGGGYQEKLLMLHHESSRAIDMDGASCVEKGNLCIFKIKQPLP